MNRKILILLTAALCLLHGVSRAAEPVFTLSGRVVDAETGETVIGAIVLVQGTTKGVSTDVNGEFSIEGVDRGTQTLVVQFAGYQTVELPVEVDGNRTGIEIKLETNALDAGQAVVHGQRRSNTEAAMLSTVKSSLQVTNGISAVQIAKSPDRSASEVVRRVPGITILEERFIVVRGLAQRYNNAWINGLAVPSTEPDSRAFSFDIIPSSQIDNLIVYKSPAPEIPGDFSGGFVKITTKGVPDQNSIEIGYTTGLNVHTQFRDFRINPGSGTDFLGFDATKRPLDKSFPSHMRLVADDPSQVTRLTRTGFNNDWRVKNMTPLPDQRLSLAIARRLETKNGRTVGNITALTYSNTFRSTIGIKNARYGSYNIDQDTPRYVNDYTDDQYANDVRLGLMHNWTFMLNSSNRLDFKNLFNLLGRNRLTERSGYSNNSVFYHRRETEMLYSSRLSYSGQLSGQHDFRGDGRIVWDAGYSYADRNEPDRRTAVFQIGGTPDLPAGDLVADHIKRYFQKLNDHIFSGAVGYSQPFRLGSIRPVFKGGLYGEFRARNYTPREFDYRYNNDFLSGEEGAGYLLLPLEEMMAQKYLGADKVYIDEITNKSYAYSADVYHAAAYAAFELPLGSFDLYFGARFESNISKLTYDRAGDVGTKLMKTNTNKDFNLLPSVNLTYHINDRHQLRAAYGRSVNRPELRELAPTVYYDFDLFSYIEGNPDLKTATIDNVDLRYEWYPAAGETISVGAFYKHFKNPIEWTFLDGGGPLQYHFENAESATNWGFELEVRKNLAFMGMRNVTLSLNAAWIRSNVKLDNKDRLVAESDRPMQGQSPYIVNAGLYYSSERLGLDVSLLYNIIGKRIVGIGKAVNSPDPNAMIPDAYEMPRNVLDLSISKKLGRRVELRATVKDLLSEDVIYKQFPKFISAGKTHEREQVTRRYNPGQSITLGVVVKL